MLTRDYDRLVKEQTRLINKLKDAVKEYYPRYLELFDDVRQDAALDFLMAYPGPDTLAELTRDHWQQFA